MKKVIKEYLLKYAIDNSWNKFDESKLDKCIAYIKSQARKRAEDGVAVIEDKEVYGWAVHYFDEDGNVEIDNNIQAKVTTPKTKPVEAKPVETKPVNKAENKIVKKVKKNEEENQLSLFDL